MEMRYKIIFLFLYQLQYCIYGHYPCSHYPYGHYPHDHYPQQSRNWGIFPICS